MLWESDSKVRGGNFTKVLDFSAFEKFDFTYLQGKYFHNSWRLLGGKTETKQAQAIVKLFSSICCLVQECTQRLSTSFLEFNKTLHTYTKGLNHFWSRIINLYFYVSTRNFFNLHILAILMFLSPSHFFYLIVNLQQHLSKMPPYNVNWK